MTIPAASAKRSPITAPLPTRHGWLDACPTPRVRIRHESSPPTNELASSLRQTRGKVLLPGWLDEFRAVAGVRLSPGALLTLGGTDRLKETLVERLQSSDARYREWPGEQTEHVVAHLHALGRAVGSTELVLFSKVDEYIGAARVGADAVLRDPMRMWEFVGTDLTLVTEDLAGGLCLERNQYTRDGDYVKAGVYALTTWGDLFREDSNVV